MPSYLGTCVLLSALAMQAQSSPETPKQPAADCSASGTVVNALTGEPVPRAMVSIANGTGDAGAATDERGNWAIAKLTCGKRLPTATHDGFLPGNQGISAAETEKRMIQLVSGTPVANVKISLIPASEISGAVRDSYGDPFHGAQVRLLRVTTQAGKRELLTVRSTVTDAEGNFRLDGLDRGSYVVCAGSQQITYPVGGGEPLIFPDSCLPGPVEMALLSPFRLEPGRELRTALTLTATRGVHVRGRITGVPAAAIDTVFPTGIEWIKATNSSYMGLGTRLVQPDGTFDIAPVQPGSYMVQAYHSVLGAAQSRLEIGSADIDNLVLTLQPPGSIVGTVRYELSHAASVPNLNIELRPEEGAITYGFPLTPKWDPDRLNFSLDGTIADRYKLKVSVRGETAYVKSATLNGQDVRKQAFRVEGTIGPIEIVVSDDTGGVDAMVNDDDGKPVAASIILLAADGRQRILITGDDGHAKDGNIPTGDYRAWAFDEIDSVPYAEPDWMVRNAGAGEKVTVTTGATANFSLKKTVLTEDAYAR